MLAGLRVATLSATVAIAPFAQADTAAALVTVGERAVSVEQATLVLQRTPAEALARLAPQTGAILERFVNDFIVAPTLLEEEAKRRASKDERFRAAVQPKVDYALQRAVERELEHASQPSAEQVKAFYDKHKRHYERPAAIRIWRILLKDPAIAQDIIAKVQGNPDGAAVFKSLAREHSLDAATKMRSGDLGFVWPNGHTDIPEVRVHKSLVAAAAKLEDGELAGSPSQEGDYIAVYWRRGTRPAVRRDLADEAKNIEAILRRDLARDKLGDLVIELRKQHLVEGDLTLLESIKYPKPSVKPVQRQPPTQHAAAGAVEPNPTVHAPAR